MTAEGTFPKVNGEILYASEVNYMYSKILSIDATTDLNVTSAGTATANKEYTFTFSQNKKYISIEVMGEWNAAGAGGDVSLTIEAKEVGGGYGTIYSKTIAKGNTGGMSNLNLPPKYVHTLTAGQITNGITIKLTTTAATGAGGSSFVNSQIIFKGE